MYLRGIQDISKIPLRDDSVRFLLASREKNTPNPHCWIKKATMVIYYLKSSKESFQILCADKELSLDEAVARTP